MTSLVSGIRYIGGFGKEEWFKDIFIVFGICLVLRRPLMRLSSYRSLQNFPKLLFVQTNNNINTADRGVTKQQFVIVVCLLLGVLGFLK